MTDSDNQQHLSWDAGLLLYQQTGVRLPVSELRYWVLGIPSPKMKTQPKFDQYGRIKLMQQDGWTIDMRRYTDTNAVFLPRKVFMQGQELDIRLVIDEWKLGTLPSDNPLSETTTS